MRDHMSTSGSANNCEIACRTSKRDSGRIATPLSSLVINEHRFLAFTAPDSEAVIFAEDALIGLVFLLPGVVPLNSSPGNCGGSRYLDDTPAGPPLLHQAQRRSSTSTASGASTSPRACPPTACRPSCAARS